MVFAGTGHRPKYCPCGYKTTHPWLSDLKDRLASYLSTVSSDTIVRAGGAIGWDTWLAQVALTLELKVHLYLPFPDKGAAWPRDSRIEYERIKGLAANLTYTSDHYHQRVFLDRDVQMITGVDKVLSLLNPKVNSGGTYYTVGEAKKMNLEVLNFWSDE